MWCDRQSNFDSPASQNNQFSMQVGVSFWHQFGLIVCGFSSPDFSIQAKNLSRRRRNLPKHELIVHRTIVQQRIVYWADRGRFRNPTE